MKLIVLGAPGAGKGTQAHFLANHYGVPHISTGTLLREQIKNNTEIGKQVDDLVNKGKLVSNEIVIEVLKDRIAQEDCMNGFILDGFPRCIEQAKITEEIIGKIDKVVLIHVNDNVIVNRISGRRMCSACGATWHLVYHPTLKESICDTCGGALTQRVDDKAKTVRDRLQIYHKEEQPIIEYFKSNDLLSVVEGQEKIEDTTACIIKVLDS